MQFIDTHGHLNFAAFSDDWQTVLDRSLAKGIKAVIMPGSQYSTSHRAVELARARPRQLFAAVGLHPTHVAIRGQRTDDRRKNDNSRWEEFDPEQYRELAKQPEVVAIGEVGLDTYRIQKTEDREQNTEDVLAAQEYVLRSFIGIAQRVSKPMILHCRAQRSPLDEVPSGPNPHERLIEILTETPHRPPFVVHCFQGTKQQAEQYLVLGGLISFTGTITYSDDSRITEVVQSVPLDRLMIETDSPYLSPVPYRGEPNEPWKVIEVARRIAGLKGLTIEQVAEQTTVNAIQFFGLQLTS